MVMRPALFAVVFAAALTAVGVGAYLAGRQNQVAAVAAVTVGEVVPPVAAVDATEQVVAPPPTVRPPAEGTAAAPAARPSAPAARPSAPAPAAPRAARTNVPAEREVARPRDAEPVRAPAPAPAEGAQAPAQSAPAAAPPPSPRRRSGRALPRVPGWERVSTDAPPRDTAPPVDTARGPDSERPAESGRPADARRAGGRESTASDLRELVIEADSVIGLQVDSFVTTRTAEVEDDVHARITRDVLAGGEVAIPAGTVVRGSVTLVERAGRVKGRSRLGVRFHTVVLDDGVEVPLVTETVYRGAGSGGSERAAQIGSAAIGGAILGAVFGGRRGAAIGGAAGAGTGAVAALASEGEPATLPYGSTLTVRLARPAVLAVPRQVI